MIKLSAVIITFNEEEHLGKCLSSLLGIADEIVVVDSYSTDDTKKYARILMYVLLNKNSWDTKNKRTLL